MPKKIIIISGSPKKNGNTAYLIDCFSEGAKASGAVIETVYAHFLKFKTNGCTSCRICQTSEKYECAVKDDVSQVLIKMSGYDVIVMATPLYFFAPSAQIKHIFDRMFSLYKWDNSTNTFKTPLKGKTFVLMASAYEHVGLEALEKPFLLTADYTGMRFESLLVPDAGISGGITKLIGVKEKASALGRKVSIYEYPV